MKSDAMTIPQGSNFWDDVAKIVEGLAAGVVAAFGFIRWYLPRRAQRREQKKTLVGLESLQKSFAVMEQAVHHQRLCDRAIIFAGHNDGGFPTAASPYYVSALHWVTHTMEAGKRIEDYRKLTVDSEYCRMVMQMVRDGFVVLTTTETPKGLLQSIYESEGIQQSLIVFIGVQNRKLIYISFARLKESSQFTQHDITRLKLLANNIANEIL